MLIALNPLKLTPDCEVDFQLTDAEEVFATTEVDAFIVLADVVYGELEDGAFLRHHVLQTWDNVLLLEPFPPGGVCRGGGQGFRAR